MADSKSRQNNGYKKSSKIVKLKTMFFSLIELNMHGKRRTHFTHVCAQKNVHPLRRIELETLRLWVRCVTAALTLYAGAWSSQYRRVVLCLGHPPRSRKAWVPPGRPKGFKS